MDKVPNESAAVDATKERRRLDLYERKRLLEKAIADLEALVELRARPASVVEIEKPGGKG